MLMLIKDPATLIGDIDLNTSYVNVNLHHKYSNEYVGKYLNTSYVNVNRYFWW